MPMDYYSDREEGMEKTGHLIWVCVDCMFVHANGETESEPDREPLNLLEGQEVTLGMLYSEHSCGRETDPDMSEECECEQQDFSWSRCEGCGSTLGGSRHAMTVWE